MFFFEKKTFMLFLKQTFSAFFQRLFGDIGWRKTFRPSYFEANQCNMLSVCWSTFLASLIYQRGNLKVECLPGLKSQSKSALNSAVSEISKISALISAVSEWVKKTSADQHCFRAVQRWFSLNQRCWTLDQNEVRNRRKCFVLVQKGIGITKNMFFWSVPAMKKIIPAKF